MKLFIKTLLNEQLVLEATKNNITDMVNLFEEDKNNSFTWDIAKDKIDSSKELIKTPNQAKNYLKVFFNKIKSLPRPLRVKLSKYVVLSFIGLLNIGIISSMLDSEQPEIKQDVINTLPPEVKKTMVEPIVKPEKFEVKQPVKSSDSLTDFLKHEEGSIRHKGEPVLKAYKLGDGMVTVGWGHAERIKISKYSVGDSINRNEAEQLLATDIKEAEDALNRILNQWKRDSINVNITQGMFDGMTSMIFNMGIGNFRKSQFIQLVKQGKFEEASEKILTTNVTYKGHIKRRQKERELFLK